MSNPYDPSDRAVTHAPYVPALDGLHGLAALLVAGASPGSSIQCVPAGVFCTRNSANFSPIILVP